MTFGKSNLQAGLDTFITKRTLHRQEVALASYDAAVRKKVAPELAIQQALVEAVKGLSDKERKLETARKAAGFTRFNLAVTHAKEKVAFHKKPTDAKTKPIATITKTKTETRKGFSLQNAAKAIWAGIHWFMQRVMYGFFTLGVILLSALFAFGISQVTGLLYFWRFGNEPNAVWYWSASVFFFIVIALLLLWRVARYFRRKEEKLHPTTSHA